MFKMKVLAIFFIASYCCAADEWDNCRKGPSYWCQNVYTAVECGVEQYCQIAETKSRFHSRATKSKAGVRPVDVALYYESLCPDCQRTWNVELFPTYLKLKSSGILDVKLIPYGNANQTKSGNTWTFNCQHGDAECAGNLIHTCAQYYYPKPEQHMAFLNCLEYYKPTIANTQSCAKLSKLDYSKIMTCAVGKLGNDLEHQMGRFTEALNPPHTSVPWFTLSGVHNDEIQNGLNNNMLSYVCNAYTGEKPNVCNDKDLK